MMLEGAAVSPLWRSSLTPETQQNVMEDPAQYEAPEKNSGGRPKKPDEERRTIKVQTNLNQLEAEKFFTKLGMSGLSEAEYVRRRVLNKEVYRKTEKPIAYKKLRADLGRTMSNINQLAKKVNQGEINDLTGTNFRALIEYLHGRLEEL